MLKLTFTHETDHDQLEKLASKHVRSPPLQERHLAAVCDLRPAGRTLEPVLTCRMDASFAALSICMSCVWLNLVASEVVSLLQTFGIIFNAPTVSTHPAWSTCASLCHDEYVGKMCLQTDARGALFVNCVLHVLPVLELCA